MPGKDIQKAHEKGSTSIDLNERSINAISDIMAYAMYGEKADFCSKKATAAKETGDTITAAKWESIATEWNALKDRERNIMRDVLSNNIDGAMVRVNGISNAEADASKKLEELL